MATAGAAWMARAQKRRNGELSMLRRPSETPTVQTTSDAQSPSSAQASAASESVQQSPSSPHSSVSTTASSIGENFDKLHALQLQVRNNNAQIEANEARMREISISDERLGTDIHDRLSAVAEMNQRLSRLKAMLARAERVANGEFDAR